MTRVHPIRDSCARNRSAGAGRRGGEAWVGCGGGQRSRRPAVPGGSPVPAVDGARGDGAEPARHGAVQADVRHIGQRARHRLHRPRPVRSGSTAGAGQRVGGRPIRSPPGERAVPARSGRCAPSRWSCTARSTPGTVWPLFVIAFAFGAADAMLAPSRRSIAPLLAPPEMFPQIVALWTATFTAASIVGPVIGGFLYSVGPSEAYALAAILEFAAIIPILDDRVRPRARADHRPADAAHRARGAAVRPAHTRWCWARSRSTCSPCCSAARSR